MSDDKNRKEKFEELKKAAEQGDANAQFNLGVCYEKGDGVEKAVEWWTKAAKQGHANAQYNLGLAYDNGRGVEKDLKEAVKWWTKAAEQGDAVAQYNLGVAYAHGDGVEKDLEEAVKWYKKAAEQGFAGAQCNLGVCYENGDGVEKDLKEAVKWCKKSAEQGIAKAQYNLGVCYARGYGVEKDLKEAVKWYKKAAEQGDAKAQYNLGLCYTYGMGVKKNLKEAVKLYEKAAEEGDVKAQYNLGFCYTYGMGVKKNLKEAVKWYEKAAEEGYAQSQYNLGVCYARGYGVEKGLQKAVEWWTKAAEQGHVNAQYNLGVAYLNGDGVEKDSQKAVEWWTKAAEQGHGESKMSLGFLYEKGAVGTPPDLKKAVKYYKMSFNGGFEIKGKEELPPLLKIISIIHKIFEKQRVDENKLKSIASITHFTSVDVLKKLLEDTNEKKSLLRVQNIDGCNDPMEGKTLYQWLDIPDLECPDMNDSYPLILSLCEGSPENLPMWNTYADNAKGVALGVDKNSLVEYTENKEHYIINKNYATDTPAYEIPIIDVETNLQSKKIPILYRVLYVNRPSGDVESEPNTSYELFDELKNVVQDEANSKDIKDIKEYKEYMNILSGLLIELSHIVKYDDYEYENEIRLVRFAFKDDITDKNNPLKNCSDSHRVYMEAKHIEFEVITTAPKVSEKMYKYIKYLGDKNKIDKVIKSKISYR